jgi:tight adherence protein C
MGLAVLTGAALGVSVVLLLVGILPARPSLAASVALLRSSATRPGGVATAARSPRQAWQARIGRVAVQTADAFGLELRSLRRDLAVVGQPLDALLAAKILTAAAAGLVVPVVAGLLALAGVPVPLLVPAWFAVGLGLVGFLLPDRRLRAAADARRARLRYATGAVLNLVAINLAGGAEVEQALNNAVRLSPDWAFSLLRNTIRRAQLGGEKVWAALGRLGEEYGVDELVQLAQNVSLAGDEGARMREALIAMAAAIGSRELTDAEIQANEASEHMVLPLTLLAAGFALFLLYPALMQLTVGF